MEDEPRTKKLETVFAAGGYIIRSDSSGLTIETQDYHPTVTTISWELIDEWKQQATDAEQTIDQDGT